MRESPAQCERVDSSECPVCREEQKESEIFLNNYDKREIMSLKIYCDQQEKGCRWKGELRERETHNEICGYVDVLCKNECGEMVMKKDMETARQVFIHINRPTT